MSVNVGSEVIATRDIWQEASGDWPQQLLARKGELLIVRKIDSEFFYAYVSHPEVTDNSFGVDPSEIVSRLGVVLK